MKKHSSLPLWFPTPLSWLKAFGLAWLWIIFFLIVRTLVTGHQLIHAFNYYPEISIIAFIISLFSPLFIITILHHLGQIIIDQWFPPKGPAKARKRPPGFFPGIASWWAGLYGWLVMCISNLITGTLYLLVLAGANLDNQTLQQFYQTLMTSPISDLTIFLASFILIWFIISALIYHFEYLAKQDFLHLNLPQVSQAYQAYYQRKMTANNQENLSFSNTIIKGKGQLPNSETTVDFLIRFDNKQSGVSQTLPTKNLVLNLSQNTPPAPAPLKVFRFCLMVVLIASLSIIGYRFWENSHQNLVLSLPLPLTYPTTAPTIAPTPESMEVPESEPVITDSEAEVITKPEESMVLLPPDPLEMAIERATNAVNLSKVARSKIEWQAIAIQWQDAIELLKLVPGGHPQYVLAQKKVAEYRQNLLYAQQKAASYPN